MLAAAAAAALCIVPPPHPSYAPSVSVPVLSEMTLRTERSVSKTPVRSGLSVTSGHSAMTMPSQMEL